MTRFPYFIAMVSEIGGIDVHNPRAFNDTVPQAAGLQGRAASTSTAYDAMAFSRIRHNLPRGDFDRSANQQRVLRGIQAKVRAQASSPGSSSAGCSR